jgi:hypothetical protein
MHIRHVQRRALRRERADGLWMKTLAVNENGHILPTETTTTPNRRNYRIFDEMRQEIVSPQPEHLVELKVESDRQFVGRDPAGQVSRIQIVASRAEIHAGTSLRKFVLHRHVPGPQVVVMVCDDKLQFILLPQSPDVVHVHGIAHSAAGRLHIDNGNYAVGYDRYIAAAVCLDENRASGGISQGSGQCGESRLQQGFAPCDLGN